MRIKTGLIAAMLLFAMTWSQPFCAALPAIQQVTLPFERIRAPRHSHYCNCDVVSTVDPCADNDNALNTYWTANISTTDGVMTCPRARAALKCTDLVVKELCAETCLACHTDIHPGKLAPTRLPAHALAHLSRC